MIAEIVALTSLVFAVVFALAWLVRPDLRAWIESPKHRFQERLREYDDQGRDDD